MGIRVLVDQCVLGASRHSLGIAIAHIECVSWDIAWVAMAQVDASLGYQGIYISRHSLAMAMAQIDIYGRRKIIESVKARVARLSYRRLYLSYCYATVQHAFWGMGHILVSGHFLSRVGHRETGHHRVTCQGRFWRFSALVGPFELLFA